MAEVKTAKKKPTEPKKTPVKAKSTAVKKETIDEFAVIETGGKQYTASVGDILTIEKLPGEPKEGEKITFDKVLLVDNGKDETTIGDPYIKGAKVIGTLLEEGKAKKIDVIKFKSKSRYFKKRGHRQPFMKVKIEDLK
ncbi:MAG: 50S ribosomal protein L21 [Parcubacteria group bacterium]|nr:50S ribosomal protein L21 [Parcubacteria group bacterium]